MLPVFLQKAVPKEGLQREFPKRLLGEMLQQRMKMRPMKRL